MTMYQRGSEWRIWDLQVHTPYSALNNGFGDDFDAYAKQLIEEAIANNIAVVGVTDYFTIDGYKELRNLLNDNDRLEKLIGNEKINSAKNILFIPNIELRTSVVITRPDGSDSRVNYHVLFSDELEPNLIEENFLRELKFTAEANPSGADEQWALTRKNLSDLGKNLKEQHEHFRDRSDLYIGMMNAVIDHGEVTKVFERQQSRFKDCYLVVVPADEDLSECNWNGQGHLIRKILIQKSNMLFSSNMGTRDFGLGKKHASVEEYINEFRSLKPCIHGSDAHDFNGLFKPANNRFTWIKADPTFKGLRQLLNEPDDRVFIGEKPPALLRLDTRPTRVVNSLVVRKLATSTLKDKWFDVEMPLNPELVAIIGNKGSGKSALADIMGLLGNTPRYASFSFLRPDRFRDPKNNKAKHFNANLAWMDKTIDEVRSLDDNPSPDSIEKIKYIPQNYLEEICNEIGLGKGSRFYAELQQVLFSHVQESERLGFSTLDELLEHRTEETNDAIDQLVDELIHIIKEIIVHEDKSTEHHRRYIESHLAEKTRELEAHKQSRPDPVKKPEEDPASQKASKEVSEHLESKQKELAETEGKIAAAVDTRSKLSKKLSKIEKLITKIQNLKRHVENIQDEVEADFEELGIKSDDVVKFTADISYLEKVQTQATTEQETIIYNLDPNIPDSLEKKRTIILSEISKLENKLSAPQKDYQNYLQQEKEWRITEQAIIGDEETVDTIKYLEKQLKDLEILPVMLKTLWRKRDRKMLEILREKQKLKKYYESYYGAVQEFLEEHPLAKDESFKLTFVVSIAQSGFSQSFLEHINQRKAGPFSGVEEGMAEVKQLLDTTNFDSALSALRFAHRLIDKMRNHNGKSLELREQLRSGVSIQEFYEFVFSLSYLTPIYSLKWEGKSLEQLSPGERGNLLLIFYLLVDRDDIPLVIDQPEENLDNQTVYKTLVPCIKDAKKRRQIVMVTHNPNLAVVCDAEQLIHSEIRKEDRNCVVYTSGSIENSGINNAIVDVLEGTRPAFDMRDAKYQ